MLVKDAMSADLFIDDKVQVIETGMVGVVVGVHGEFSYAVRFYEDDECEFFERSQLRHISYACWNTGTKAQTLVFLKEIGREDVPTIINELVGMEQEDNVDDWDVAIMDCGICGHREVAVFPHGVDEDSFECEACHNMASRPVVIDEEEQIMDAPAKSLPQLVEVVSDITRNGYIVIYLDSDKQKQRIFINNFDLRSEPKAVESWQNYLIQVLRERDLL